MMGFLSMKSVVAATLTHTVIVCDGRHKFHFICYLHCMLTLQHHCDCYGRVTSNTITNIKMKIRGSKGLSNKTFTQADAHHLWSGEHKEG